MGCSMVFTLEVSLKKVPHSLLSIQRKFVGVDLVKS
jgi:hypothetical protein